MCDGSGFGRNVIIFVGDISLSVHIDNEENGIFIFGIGPVQVLDDTTLTVEKEYPINFTE